jgi:hypothetical protein
MTKRPMPTPAAPNGDAARPLPILSGAPAASPGPCPKCGRPLSGNRRCYPCENDPNKRGIDRARYMVPEEPRASPDVVHPGRVPTGPTPIPPAPDPVDPEVQAMAGIVATLARLDAGGRRRVLDYLAARFPASGEEAGS